MKLLRDARCKNCGAIIKVPIIGFYNIECASCETRNELLTSPVQKKAPKKESAPKKSVSPTPEETTPEETTPEETTPEETTPEETTPEETTPEETTPVIGIRAATFPEWKSNMLKAELLAIAMDLGLSVTAQNTKKEITSALETAEAEFAEVG